MGSLPIDESGSIMSVDLGAGSSDVHSISKSDPLFS